MKEAIRTLEFIAPDASWMVDAACKGYPTEWWFPLTPNSNTIEARRICKSCPVIDQCEEYADQIPALQGIWANQSFRERTRRRRSTDKHRDRHLPIIHGSAQGYNAHRRRNETPCGECRIAHNEYNKQRKRRARELKRAEAEQCD